jgi:calcineurin-like phosphoesterase family protein
MANVWFIGDLHGGHKNVHRFRNKFSSEEEHYETVKSNFNSVVTKRDKVFFMGDAFFTKERLEDLKNWNGAIKVLICGNHDTDSLTMKELCEHFDEVYSFYKWHEFWLSHCPIHPDELRGKTCIHGHIHDHMIDDPRYFNTCLEHHNFFPVDLNTIRKRNQK